MRRNERPLVRELRSCGPCVHASKRETACRGCAGVDFFGEDSHPPLHEGPFGCAQGKWGTRPFWQYRLSEEDDFDKLP